MDETSAIDKKNHSAGNPNAKNSSAYPKTLLCIFSIWWLILAIAPRYRQDWLLENVLVFVALPLFLHGFRTVRFSNLGYTCVFIFMCLHELGAHYTYSEVPYADWFKHLTGADFQATFGTGRNHFDRLIHFLFGFLMIPLVIELFNARAALQGIWRHLIPVTFMMSLSELYELIEWQAAEMFGGPLGQAYLGTQGDVWDAQKDSAMAAIGALLGLLIYRMVEYRGNLERKSAKTMR